MKIKRSELEFLEIFSMCVDNKNPLNDKFQVKSNGTDVVFTQMSNEATIIKAFESKETINVMFPTNQFTQLIKSFSADTEIDITDKGVVVGESKYEFEKVDYELPSTEQLYQKTKSDDFTESFTLSDIKKMNTVKFCMGQEDLATIALMENSFVASNKSDITGVIKTANTFDKEFYFSKGIISILLKYGFDSISVDIEDDFYHLSVNDVDMFVAFKEFSLPNILSEDFKTIYEHPYECSVVKKDIQEILGRIKVFASSTVERRIHVTFKDKEMIVESKEKDSGYAVEKIKATYSDELEGHHIILSVSSFSTLISYLTGNTVMIRAINEKDANVIKIYDEIGDMFFIQCLYSYE